MVFRRSIGTSSAWLLALLLALGSLPAAAQEAEDPGPVEITLAKAWFGLDGGLLEEAPNVDWGLSMEAGEEPVVVASLPGADNTATFEWVEVGGVWHPARYGVQETPAPVGWQAVACDDLQFDEAALDLPAAIVERDTSALKVQQGAPDGSIPATDSGVHLICNQRTETADLDPSWPDLSVDNTHYQDIIDLAIDGILLGRADGTFGPAAAVTRGQVATVLAKTAGLTDVIRDTPTFSDTAGTTHEASIEALVELDIISGFADGRFGPNLWVTRGQLATILGRWLELDEVAEGPFIDVPVDSTHAGYINALAAVGVITGTTPTTFGPFDDMRRDQFAALVNRAR